VPPGKGRLVVDGELTCTADLVDSLLHLLTFDHGPGSWSTGVTFPKCGDSLFGIIITLDGDDELYPQVNPQTLGGAPRLMMNAGGIASEIFYSSPGGSLAITSGPLHGVRRPIVGHALVANQKGESRSIEFELAY
jgi:hypothetical protein